MYGLIQVCVKKKCLPSLAIAQIVILDNCTVLVRLQGFFVLLLVQLVPYIL